MSRNQAFESRRTTVAEAIRLIPRGKHLFVGSGAAEPVSLVAELVAQADRFADNTVVHLMTLGPAPYVEPQYESNFRHNAFFIGANVREAVHEGRADYTPVFLSKIPDYIRYRRMPVDVALIQVTPPDPYGYVNLGVSVDIQLAAIEAASLVIAEVNPNMPVIHGSGYITVDRIDAWVEATHPLPEAPPEPLDDIALQIGRHVAALVDDGCTVQVGIGQIPDATLKALSKRKDLGVWTEMFSDGVIDLIENGNITGKYKTIHPRKVSSSFMFGSKRVYEYVDRHPMFTFHPSDYINNPINIAQQHKMVAINSALQIDLTGQVCADSIGTRFYSGIGGQVDFVRGASMCRGGKPIIAIRSTARKGTVSRIAAVLDPGAGVVTSRGDVRFVATEYGSVDLVGKSIRDRALALISIAHPDFRADLLAAAKERRYVFTDQIEPQPDYPYQYEKPFTTRGDRPVLLRPIRVTDEPKLRDLFYSLSNDTIYRRWMRLVKSMPHRDLLYYLDVDYHKTVAIVVETQADSTEPEIVGVARYHSDPATNFAEVAFLIRDDWQGQGLGGALFEHLIQIGTEHGISGFTAEVLSENHAMLRVFHRSGLRLESSLTEGVYSLVMYLTPEEAPVSAPLHRPPKGRFPVDTGRFLQQDIEEEDE